jgi:hypothetical protein
MFLKLIPINSETQLDLPRLVFPTIPKLKCIASIVIIY